MKIYTYAGFVDLDHPDPRVFADPIKIGEQLEAIPRWNAIHGSTYSVGDHSLLGAIIAPDSLRRLVLWHDSHEIVLGDLPYPLRQSCGYLRVLDQKWSICALETILGTPPTEEELRGVEIIDRALAATEARDLCDWNSSELEEYFPNGPLSLSVVDDRHGLWPSHCNDGDPSWRRDLENNNAHWDRLGTRSLGPTQLRHARIEIRERLTDAGVSWYDEVE